MDIRIVDLEKQIEEEKNKPPLGWKEYIDDKYKFKIWHPEKVSDGIYGLEFLGVCQVYLDSSAL